MATTRRDFLRSGTLVASTLAGQRLLKGAGDLSGAKPAAHRVKVALVGTAHGHALAKLATLLKLADLYEVVGIVEPDKGRRQLLSLQAQFAGIPLLTEEQLLDSTGVEAVLVETQVKDVVATATRLASSGLHIHAEKPGGPSLPAFRNLQDVVRQKGRILQTGYMLRRNPAFEFCARAVREGLLGEIDEIHGVMGKVADAAERKTTAIFSGGMMFELASHLIDATVGLLGKPQTVASYLRVTHPNQDSLADNTLAVLEYPNALATISSSANDVMGGQRRGFSVHGEKGAINILPIEPPKLTLTLATPQGAYKKGPQPIELRKMTGRFDDQLSDFARIIRGEKELDVKPDHDLAVLETVLRASGMPTNQ